MEVSMDGLRKSLISDYNSLVCKLNNSIGDTDSIFVGVNEIQRELDGIRNGIVTLAYCYMDGPGGFEAMDENVNFETFNPKEEE
jgi:hypothetical protein